MPRVNRVFNRNQNVGKAAGALAQLVARRSHNPKVVSSILTGSVLPSLLSLAEAAHFANALSGHADVVPR